MGTVFSPRASVRDATAARKAHTHSIEDTTAVVQPTVRTGVSSHTHKVHSWAYITLTAFKFSSVQLKKSSFFGCEFDTHTHTHTLQSIGVVLVQNSMSNRDQKQTQDLCPNNNNNNTTPPP